MNLIFRLWLTANQTELIPIVYAIKSRWAVFGLPCWIVHISLVLLWLLSSRLTLYLSKYFGEESLLHNCKDITLADSECLATCIGYIAIALVIYGDYTMLAIFLPIFFFSYLSQSRYFNPVYLLFGYHYYHVLTPGNTKIFVIKHGAVIRNPSTADFKKLRRLNDMTFVETKV